MEERGVSSLQKAKTQIQGETQEGSGAWNIIPWRKLEEQVFSIQKRIYQASLHGKIKEVQELQKLLTKSQAARIIAVRKVTQENTGKRTAGIDGIKSLPPEKRLDLAESIHPKYWKGYKPKPVRRVWIEKPGKTSKRPLGIPTIQDRALQALIKIVMEPEWEARFEPRSYGFRPGRSAHDAIEHIFSTIRQKPKYVFDADIKGCFDNIDHQALLEKIHTYPAIRKLIKAWLKAGVLEGQEFLETEKGAPQGSVISPLLANIALHGIEEIAKKGYKAGEEKPILVRYADDFIIMYSDKEKLEEAAKRVTEKLREIGLELNKEKTSIRHTLNKYEGNIGFTFLGFAIRQYAVGKTHSGKKSNGKLLGFKTIIKPSKQAINSHVKELGDQIKAYRTVSQETIINKLNPIIRGWTNYFRTVVARGTFKTCVTAQPTP